MNSPKTPKQFQFDMPKKKLFSQAILNRDASLTPVPADVTTTEATHLVDKSEEYLEQMYQDTHVVRLYAVTLNICPNKIMNKRKWSSYSQKQQIAQLTRIEASIRKGLDMTLHKLVFENCPTLQQMHYHAMYSSTSQEMIAYDVRMKKYSPKETGTFKWRTVDVKEVYDEKGWLEYLKKDQK